jgi:SAM-dependent methyltransferase
MTDANDLERAIARWNTRCPGSYTNTRRDWDERSADWDAWLRGDDVRARQGEERVRAVAGFLRDRGLLGLDHDVVDVGCGPGRFVTEFARTARRVVGLDFSARMIEAGERLSRERGLADVEFSVCDFQAPDAFDPAWEGAFDLAFSSITPAIAGLDALERFIRLSRAWCMNVCFARYENELHDRVLAGVFGRPPRREQTGHSHWLTELLDVLRHLGHRPEVATWEQPRELALPAGPALAGRLAEALLGPEERTGHNLLLIEAFLRTIADPDGTVTERSDCRYGWTLWDVRARGARR